MAKKQPNPRGAGKTAPVPGSTTADAEQALFPIIALGASAGGLEALEQFFSHTPPDSGVAFVVIQHMDPTRTGMLPELLGRVTKHTVVQATDRLQVKPNHIYVIPPNKDMSILRGSLYLFDPTEARGLRSPIDFFFRSLAEDQLQNGVGVILSGMGSDGAAGLRSIKEKGGLTAVQQPTSAKFDGMPRSALDATSPDVIAPADELARQLLGALHRGPAEAPKALDLERQSTLEKILFVLRSQTGADFSQYKKSTLYRRIERRMGVHQANRIADYLNVLRKNVQEVHMLYQELLIGVTGFFRDPDAWVSLKSQALPLLLDNAAPRRTLRAWVPARATGEEAFSLAILFKELSESLGTPPPLSLQIYATDLDENAVERARRAVYPKSIANDVSPERLSRYFVPDEGGFRVAPSIREMVIFAKQNVISDPPFTRLDILCCRNLLIYLTAELQRQLVPLFHYCLVPSGILFLGSAETIGNFSELFTPLDGRARLYQRSAAEPNRLTWDLPSSLTQGSATARPVKPSVDQPLSLQAVADEVLLRRYGPAAVLANDQGDILYINGRTGNYLEPTSGKADWNIYAMAREGLQAELATAFVQALRQQEPVVVPRVRIENGLVVPGVRLIVEQLRQPEALRGLVLIVFQELTESPPDLLMPLPVASDGAGTAQHGREIYELREELQTTREEMQSSQEELKSANEELQSTNEELQSTNEELTTSKEEMQSLNEELQTVNQELQSKLDDLMRAHNDMTNLLNSTEIATVFLDNGLLLRRFTPAMTRIIKLLATDIGRPLSDLATDLDYPDMFRDALEVLRTLVFSEKEVPTVDGRWFIVRIMPYRTLDNVIDGVVITFLDVTKAKKLEADLLAVRSDGG